MRILGIDLGSFSVKAVELDSAFGRFEVHEYYEQKVEAGSTPFIAAQNLLASLPKAPDRIAMAMSTRRTTFRNLSLPTRDRKAVQAGVGFELDDDLPFAIEDAAYDYSVVKQVGQLTQLHVAATLKTHLNDYLAQLRAVQIEPDLVTTESWAYRTLMNRALEPGDLAGDSSTPPSGDEKLSLPHAASSPHPGEPPVMLIQMGHERTILYVHFAGLPLVGRELPFGGHDLTAAIAAKYGIPVEQAESAKLDNGFVLPPSQREKATQEQSEFSDIMIDALYVLLKEVRHASLTAKNSAQKAIGTIYLAGGGSLLPGIGRLLEEEVRIPVRTLKAMSTVAGSGVTYADHTESSFALAASLALCWSGPERNRAINLRKGEFAKKGSTRSLNMAMLKRPLMSIAITLTCFLTSIVVQTQVYEARLKTTDLQLEKSIKSFSSSISASGLRSYLKNPSSLKSKINQDLEHQRAVAALMAPNPKNPIAYLKGLSLAVPKDLTVDMMKFQVGAAPGSPYSDRDEHSVSISLLLTSRESADRLQSILDKKIAGIIRSPVEEIPPTDPKDPKSRRYKVTFSGKAAEAAYGQ